MGCPGEFVVLPMPDLSHAITIPDTESQNTRGIHK